MEQARSLPGRELTRMRKSPLSRFTRAIGPDTSFITMSPLDEASESPLDMREGAMIPLSPAADCTWRQIDIELDLTSDWCEQVAGGISR